MLWHIVETYAACQRLRPLIAKVKAQSAAIVVDVEFIVLIDSSQLCWIDSYADTDAPVDGYKRERGLVAGL